MATTYDVARTAVRAASALNAHGPGCEDLMAAFAIWLHASPVLPGGLTHWWEASHEYLQWEFDRWNPADDDD